MEHAERVVIIAGGTGALGRAISVAFLDSGARVVVTYRRLEEYRAFSASRSPLIEGAAVDVTSRAEVEKLVREVVGRHTRIDVLVNAVGGYAGGRNLWEADDATYERMLALNLRSGFVLARAVLPVMLRQGSGAIINVASKAGYGHSPSAALYAASKAGALALFESLAEEVKNTKIRVNSIVPSIFDTEANRKAMPKADFSNWPKPEEIARVVHFLCSEAARVIHGAAIPVYGGT